MKPDIRRVIAVLVAVLALGAVAASSASAHEFYIEGKSMKELGIKEETYTSKNIANVVMTISSDDIEITCGKAKGKGTLDQGGTGLTTLELTGCSYQKPSTACKVVEPVVVTNVDDDLVEVGGVLSDELARPKKSETLFTLYSSQCTWEEIEVTGKLVGSVKSDEAEKETQEASFEIGTGSELQYGGKNMVMTFTESSQLSGANSGKKWSARK